MTDIQENNWDTLLSMLRDLLGIETDVVTPESKLVDHLGATWLDLVDFAIAVQQRFEVDVRDEDIAGLVTAGDALAYLTKHQVPVSNVTEAYRTCEVLPGAGPRRSTARPADRSP